MNPIDLTPLVGRTVAEAQQLVESQGYTFRVILEAGKPLFVTADWRTDRVNVEVSAGKVVRADIG